MQAHGLKTLSAFFGLENMSTMPVVGQFFQQKNGQKQEYGITYSTSVISVRCLHPQLIGNEMLPRDKAQDVNNVRHVRTQCWKGDEELKRMRLNRLNTFY